MLFFFFRSKITNKTGVVPAVCLQPVNETNINSSDTFSIPAFELFPSLDLSNNSFEPVQNFQYNFNATNSIQDNHNQGASQPTINQVSTDLSQVYYAIEDYVDEVGDGVNLTRGKKVVVSKKF